MRNLYLLLFFVVSLSSNAQEWGLLGDLEKLPFYGGFAWDFEIGSYKGEQIIFVSLSGGDGIYYATFPKGEVPKRLNWKTFYATRAGGPFYFPSTSKMQWHQKTEQLFFISDYELYKAKLGEEAEFIHRSSTFLLVGDTLISPRWERSAFLFDRQKLLPNGQLELISQDPGPDYYIDAYYQLSLDPKTKRVVYWGDTILQSREPYYSKAASLNYEAHNFSLDRSGFEEDPICHIDAKGVWHVLASQNKDYFFTYPDTTLYPPKPRLWFRSFDEGQTWTEAEEINEAWPLAYTLPPLISSASDERGDHIIAGSLYRTFGKDWQQIGSKYKSRGDMFVYAGASAFLSGDASKAFHATNLGPALSTAYGDSLFLLSENLIGSPMSDFYYERKSHTIVAASSQQIAVLQEAATPYETWHYLAPPDRFPRYWQVAYSAQGNTLYAADRKLYRRDLYQGRWKMIMDPEEMGFFLGSFNQILDLAIDPINDQRIAVVLDDYDRGYTILYSEDGGDLWDSLPLSFSYNTIDRLRWFPQGAQASRLYFSQPDPYYFHQNKMDFYHFEPGNDPVLMSDSIPGFGPDYCHLIQYDQIPGTDRLVVLSTIPANDSVQRRVDFTLAIQDENLQWDTLYGEWVEDCYGCYSYPSSVMATEDFVFVGVGHWLYMYQHGDNNLRYVGRRPNPMPRGENYRYLELIDNYMYVGGEYGVFRHHLYEYIDPDYPDESWNFYPNPSAGELRIQPPGKIEVYTLDGQRVYKGEEVEYLLDLSHLPQGMYMVRRNRDAGKLWYRE
ncbi:T9SS type A sorting domain-containing protein [Croceimicrobium hydrocarbonivorans]|uniref:T9SS type A sorting domain-containing protein n=1 Tax=Croceimicrobium hydrocarbonivorans TaxID=2761580 RepID=A0A7H0VIQ7_9FLAO|nr:T9SS type A sorting domain-containing protein [Croceimicrobium hydrocarbonivorans]QNR25605.1 T9SS type A sorting domain-containing protein [Croceimicrobium hydrocarbonivorans]